MNLIISYLLIGVYLVSSCDNLARVTASHVEIIFNPERGIIFYYFFVISVLTKVVNFTRIYLPLSGVNFVSACDKFK